MRTAAYFGGADRVSAPARRRAAGRGLPQRIPPLPQRAVGETTLNKKMRAFGDEVALTVAPFYLIHMLQRTLPPEFIAPCLPTKTDKLPSNNGVASFDLGDLEPHADRLNSNGEDYAE